MSKFTFSNIGMGRVIKVVGVVGTLLLAAAALLTIAVSQSQFHIGRRPLHISPEINISVGDSIKRAKNPSERMIPISVEYTIKNTSKRKLFVAGGASLLQGITISNDKDWNFEEQVRKLSKKIIAGYSLFERFDRTEERSVSRFPLEKKVFAVGTLLAGRDLDPNESVKISDVFFVKENEFDAVDIDTMFYIVNDMKNIWSEPYFFIEESFYGIDLCRMTKNSYPPLSCPPLRYYLHIYKEGRPNEDVRAKLKRVIYVYESKNGTCPTTDDKGSYIKNSKGKWCYMAVGNQEGGIKEGKVSDKQLIDCFETECGAEIMPMGLVTRLYDKTLPRKVLRRLKKDSKLLNRLEFDVFRDHQTVVLGKNL